MDPKDNDMTTPSTDNQAQATAQQQADGELIVSHETDLDTDSIDQSTPAANADVPTAPAAPMEPSVAPTPLGDQPATPLQPFSGDLAASANPSPQPPVQPDATQPFPAATPDPTASVAPSTVAPVVPDPNMPAPDPATPEQTAPTEGKNKAMMLLIIGVALVVILGLGAYALTAL